MSMLVADPLTESRLLAERRASGADRWDEVWDGVYVIMPLPNDEHQELVAGWIYVLMTLVGIPKLGSVRPGVNVSDQAADWTHNYRCPDVVVYLRETAAENRETFWLGGPDFAVEILSKGDRARQKLDFYAKVNVRELLLIDRDPWALELYRLGEGRLNLVGRSTLEDRAELASEVVPLGFRLAPGGGRPAIEVVRRGGEGRWSI